MIVPDANLLLYAYDAASLQHATARKWLERVFSGGEVVGLPWQSVTAFLRIVTNQKLPGKRFTSEEAAGVVDQWLDQPNVRLLTPGEHHWTLLRRMMVDGQARGPLITDAQLAALTIECGGVLHTTDRDFARFPGLRWTNPLS
ncbi:MAG TPA: type II toxin-antitoxin system VapC family toxin [Bryobacteraceae bacterium]